MLINDIEIFQICGKLPADTEYDGVWHGVVGHPVAPGDHGAVTHEGERQTHRYLGVRERRKLGGKCGTFVRFKVHPRSGGMMNEMKVSAIHASELVELLFLTVLALCFQQVRVLFVTLD